MIETPLKTLHKTEPFILMLDLPSKWAEFSEYLNSNAYSFSMETERKSSNFIFCIKANLFRSIEILEKWYSLHDDVEKTKDMIRSYSL